MRKNVKPSWVFAVALAVTIPALALLKTTVFSNNKNTISSDNTTKYDVVADLGDGGKFESGGFSKMPNGKWIYKYTPSKNPTPVPKPVKEGYTFDGWLVDGNQTPKPDYTIPAWNRKNINLIAKWSASASVLLPGSQFNKYIHDNLSLSRLNDMKFVKGKPDLTGLDWVDVSQSQNESIIAYMDDHVLTVASDSDIIANEDCSFMFNNFYQIYTLKLDNFDTSNVTNMSNMFNYCVNLIELDVSKFNTNNVTDMSGMFDTCYNLTSLDLNNFNTRNVISMKRMFRECCNLVSLDLSKFNTSNVTDMSEMFYCTFCKTKASLNVSTFNTGKVKTMESMFGLCGQLDELDLSSFNTKNVSTMCNMFTECYNLKTIKFGDFNFSNLKNTSGMFLGCEKLSGELTITDANVDNYEGMFKGCSLASAAKFIVKYKDAQTKELARKMVNTKNPNDHVYLYNPKEMIDGPSFNSKIKRLSGYASIKRIVFENNLSSNVTSYPYTDVSLNQDKSILAYLIGDTLHVGSNGIIIANSKCNGMFEYFKNVIYIDIKSLDTSNVTDMFAMFRDCWELQTLELGDFKTGNVINMATMFRECRLLTSLNMDSFDTSKVTDMSMMFHGCTKLQNLDLTSFNTSNVKEMDCMFVDCTNLVDLDLSTFNFKQVKNFHQLLAGSFKLKSIHTDIPIRNNADCTYMLSRCESLIATVIIDSLDSSKITDMFKDCSKNVGAKTIVNYTNTTSKQLAQKAINTKGQYANVMLGTQVSIPDGKMVNIFEQENTSKERSITPTPKPVNLTLNNGPSAQYPKQVVTVQNNRIPNLTAPELNPKYAGQFGGYYYDEQCTKPVKQGDIVTKDLTIYARW